MCYIISELNSFTDKLHKIIDVIDEKSEDVSNKIIIINKLHFYAQNFFVNNELALQNDSEKLQKVKIARQNFLSGLKQTKVFDSEKEGEGLNNLKIYLENWLDENTVQ